MYVCMYVCRYTGLAGGSVVKNPPANGGDAGLIPGLEKSLGEGPGNPLQYSCLENSMDRGAWQATDHGVAKSWTQLSMSMVTIADVLSLCLESHRDQLKYCILINDTSPLCSAN